MNNQLRVIGFVKHAKVEMFIKTLIALLIVSFGFGQAFLLARGVGAVLAKESLTTISTAFGGCLACIILKAIFVRVQEAYGKHFGKCVKNGIRQEAIEKILKLGPAYQEESRTGNLQSLITDGIESFEPYVTQYLPQTIVVVITTIFSVVFLWHIDSRVGIVVLIMALISVFIPYLFMPKVSDVMIEYWQEYGSLNSQYIDDMCGITTLKSLGISKKEGERLADMAWSFARQSLRNLGVSLSDSAIIIAAMTVGTSLSIVFASHDMALGKITFEQLLLVLFFSGECMKPLYDMNTYWHASYLGLSVADELFTLYDAKVDVVDGTNSYEPSRDKRPEITFDNVTFSYGEREKAALNNINLTIESGKQTAFVGKSGSGKSTIVKLLLRFYNVTSGKLLIDGKELEDYTVESIRENCSVVFQDSYLFYGSLFDNIKMANPNATDSMVYEAAKIAKIDEFIDSLQEGYNTLVGERGATLSGGQRQRVSIARAILKDAPILIFDEATSSVDVKNEKAIQESINNITEDKTTIVIAHRLSTVENADLIYVMDEGKIVGCGTHEYLLKTNAYYQNLARRQGYEC